MPRSVARTVSALVDSFTGARTDEVSDPARLLSTSSANRWTWWQEAAGVFGRPGTYFSVADITDLQTLELVRAHKKDMKAAAKAATATKAVKAKSAMKATKGA